MGGHGWAKSPKRTSRPCTMVPRTNNSSSNDNYNNNNNDNDNTRIKIESYGWAPAA